MGFISKSIRFLLGTAKRTGDSLHDNNTGVIDRIESRVVDTIENYIDWIVQGYRLPFSFSALKRHCYILAKSGSGKSELLKYIFYELQRTSEKKQQRALVLIEPHGDLSQEVKNFAINKGSERLIYIDPYLAKEYTPVFNPLEISDKSEQNIDIVSQELVSAFEQVMKDTTLTLQMGAVLKPCIATLLRTPHPTLYDLQRFMDDKNNEDLVQLGTKSPIKSHRDFFATGFMNKSYKITKDSLYIKLQSLLNSPIFSKLVIGKSTIDIEQAINEGKVLIFNLSKGKMGTEVSKAFGVFIVATIQSIILKRIAINPDKRKPVFVFIDEFQNYVSESIETALSELRKYGLHLLLAHQFVKQIDTKIRDNVLSNTAVKAVGENNDTAYSIMSKELNIDKELLQHIPLYHFYIKSSRKQARLYKSPSFLVKQKKKYYLSELEAQTEDNKQIVRNYIRIEKTPRQQADFKPTEDNKKDNHSTNAKLDF